ncbi:2,3-diphosphoglycerate-dependent phosphoglycerate mutase [Candidatus Parcubacteria bacterium]|nr:MAG: 2,3-diphosphoglycerate-dependent phosphoglycerate mutase [Candidatus Parcubacteria bacterium]
MAKLILVRHAKSAWNAEGKWTGWADPSLSSDGRDQAKETAKQLHGLDIHKAYSSVLRRAHETLDIILEHIGLSHIDKVQHAALNERDYGEFTGKNKWEVKQEVGDERFQRIRRGWDEPIPGGETLKNVHDRVVPYYKKTIHPDLLAGFNVAIVAHGNSLRALVKHLESISEEEIADLEIGVGEAHVYEMDAKGKIIGKEIRAENVQKGKI